MTNERNTLLKALSTCKKKGIGLGRKDRAVLRAWAACPHSHRLQRSATRRVQIRVARAEMKQSIFSRPGHTTGDLDVGENAGGPTRVVLGGPQAHILQVAGSGAGKSNNNRIWLSQLADKAQRGDNKRKAIAEGVQG